MTGICEIRDGAPPLGAGRKDDRQGREFPPLPGGNKCSVERESITGCHKRYAIRLVVLLSKLGTTKMLAQMKIVAL